MARCQNCKAEVDPSFKFCRQCGTALKPEGVQEPREAGRTSAPVGPSVRSQTEARAVKGGRARARWLIPLVVVVVAVLGGGGYYFRASLPFVGASNPPVRAEQHLNQGVTFAAMKDYDNAILAFTKAIEADSKYTAAYANRGVAYIQQKKFNKALDDLKKAEELNPKDKMVYYNLTALYSLQDQRDRALDALDKSLELGFDDYNALRSDPDLSNLRRDPEFRKVLEKHKVFLR